MAADGDSIDRSHRSLAALLRPEWRSYLGVAAVVAVAGVLPVAVPLLTRSIVDRAAEGDTVGDLFPLAVALLAAAVSVQVAGVLATWWSTHVAWSTTDRLRRELTAHTLDLGMPFHTRHGTGAVVQRIDGDLTSVSDLLGGLVSVMGTGLVTLTAITVSLFVLSVPVGLGFVAYLAVFALLALALRRRSVGEAAAELGATGALLGEIEEVLGAAEDLRTLGAARHVERRLLARSRDWSGAVRSTFDAYLGIHRIVNGGVTLGLVLAIVASGALLGSDRITLGTSFALLQFALQTRRPLNDMIQQMDVIQRAAGAMTRVAQLRDEPPAVPDAGTGELGAGPLSVRFDDVGFAYGNGPAVLDGVSLEVPAGTHLGLVGRTGSGKTTLTRLALRLADPTSGDVLVDGVRLPELRLDGLRARVAFLDQHARLFTASVRDNVTLFGADRDDASVVAALDAVGLGPLLATLPDGLDTVVGPGGTALSAGEGQLLALARVWLRDPSLVVLDEATASVDPATEARISTAIDALLAGRTAIVVAHRLSTLARVDQIAVLDRGRVIEAGTPADLLAADGAYAELLRLSDAEVMS